MTNFVINLSMNTHTTTNFLTSLERNYVKMRVLIFVVLCKSIFSNELCGSPPSAFGVTTDGDNSRLERRNKSECVRSAFVEKQATFIPLVLQHVTI